ncbi:MAG: sigma-70 family RNA polymerase sigma factor [Candidatus Nitrohelix vancouverensis]|uniref:Sigma-70 family RNA polymerase sigma factor n=1 Tax=Candidatus Nitrohelix vancouverensis TaxID=2705534 RepID=A0A7T0C418_9BACT|nr:MAG: sigma-70 family RNA polymerase sigma factor [Candidatus Nitrohelix vancouverensis]
MDFLLKFENSLEGRDEEIATFNRHLRPHFDLIFKSAIRLCGNYHDSEDLVQETFYIALKNFHQLKQIEKCKPWLFSILRNLFLKEINRKKNRKEIEFDSVCEVLHDSSSLERDLIRAQLKSMIDISLKSLDERLRAPLDLFYFQDKSYKEISEALQIPIGTVMSRIARAKVYLRNALIKSDESATLKNDLLADRSQ